MVFQIHLEMNVGAQASDGKKNARGCGVGGTEFTLRQAPFDPWKSGANGRLRANGGWCQNRSGIDLQLAQSSHCINREQEQFLSRGGAVLRWAHIPFAAADIVSGVQKLTENNLAEARHGKKGSRLHLHGETSFQFARTDLAWCFAIESISRPG